MAGAAGGGTATTTTLPTALGLTQTSNEVDDWNIGDYEAIRRIGRDLNMGQTVSPWIPNAGTQLVIDVMNEIKRTYPFVDLLKSEIEAVIPILLALDPGVVTRLPRMVPVDARRTWDRFRMAVRLLGKQQAETDMDQPDSPSSLDFISSNADARSKSRHYQREAAGEYANALLDRIEQKFQDNEDPMVTAMQDEQEGYLGGWRTMWKLATGDKVEAVREALEGLKENKSFDIDDPDQTFKALDEHVGAEIDFILAGHTHLERALPRRNGCGYYFNSGTWARLIRLDTAALSNPDRFREIFNVLEAGTVQALDAKRGLVEKCPGTANAKSLRSKRRRSGTKTVPNLPGCY